MDITTRVTSGTAKNRKLKIPDIEGIRVHKDVFKQALFNIIGEKIVNANCLDLFAGSGSAGIEALSRGAKHCDFVDHNKRAITTIQENLSTCGLQDLAQIFHSDCIKYIANIYKKYNVIFCDPFYSDLKHKFLLKNLAEILEKGGLIAFSHSKDLNLEEQLIGTSLKILQSRKYGESFLSIIGFGK